MQQIRRVILLGDSLILAGMQARLEAVPGLEVATLGWPDIRTTAPAAALRPAAVVFELGEGQPDFPLALLQRADLLLIGIDPETHKALVWSGQTQAAQAAADLLELIQQWGILDRRPNE